MGLKVFVDFDGTITREDVGNAFFREFGGEQCTEFVARYRAGAITAKQLFRDEVAAIGFLDVRRANAFLQQQAIDETFRDFVKYCRSKNLELLVVSDGLDYYIKEIFRHNGIADVPFFANVLDVPSVDNGFTRPVIRFPFDDAECTRCACCKRNIMLTRCNEDDIIVYVGEGYSDRCPARYADIVFAKDELQKFCQEENISYFLYRCFSDVRERLKEILARKRIKPRREAEMKRREAFTAE